jgi:prepilin signal peptidase PulO-like enzyme (type II secretory pathway)
MRAIISFPIVFGIIAAVIINYLADILPLTMKFKRPVCCNPVCGKSYAWLDYLLLRRCKYCMTPRGWRIFVVLILCVGSALYLWFYHPTKLGFILSFIILTYLYLIALIDLEHRLVLRSLSIIGLFLTGLTGCILHGWLSTLLGGFAGFFIMYIIYLFGKLLNRLRARWLAPARVKNEEVLATGDITLATILGLFMGWPLICFGLLVGILLAGLVGLVIFLAMVVTRRYRQQALLVYFPLGPAYILSSILLIYLPSWIDMYFPI